MEFKEEELVEREIEIAGYFIQGLSLKNILIKTGLSKTMLSAHLHNMMEKLGAADVTELIVLIRKRGA